MTQTEDARLGSSTRLDLHPGPSEDVVLAHRVHVGLGVLMDIELTASCCWRGLTFPTRSRSARALVDALIAVPSSVEHPPSGGTVAGRATLLSRTAHPLLRVAVVDALDRWLHLPLDQSLLDAERGVSRLALANCLPDGPGRACVVADALATARRAAEGVTAHLDGLGHGVRMPSALRTALGGLAQGFAALTREIDGGERDDELESVVDGWRRLARRDAELPDPVGGRPLLPTAVPVLDGPGHAMIDPRQSWARTFALSADPEVAEVGLHAPSGGSTVTVRAPLFEDGRLTDLLSRLVVRLRDRGSGAYRGESLLTTGGVRADGSTVLEASVPRGGSDLADLRVDLLDVLVTGRAPTDDGAAVVRRVRRAVRTTSSWRSLLGVLTMPVRADEGARATREAVTALLRLSDVPEDPDTPICAGAPTRAWLASSAAGGDVELVERLRGFRSTAYAPEAHRLTVAELAAASDRLGG